MERSWATASVFNQDVLPPAGTRLQRNHLMFDPWVTGWHERRSRTEKYLPWRDGIVPSVWGCSSMGERETGSLLMKVRFLSAPLPRACASGCINRSQRLSPGSTPGRSTQRLRIAILVVTTSAQDAANDKARLSYGSITSGLAVDLKSVMVQIHTVFWHNQLCWGSGSKSACTCHQCRLSPRGKTPPW